MALSEITKITGPGIHTLSNVLSHNIKSSGIITATKFVGPVEGSITATDATFSGNVSIAGTLTYEDVTNIDSVGIITAPAVDVDDFLDVGSNIKLGNAGVITATSFRGDGSQLTGIVAGLSTISGVVNVVNDLDVDGHTNLDNVSIAGVTTFASNVFLGDNDRILFGDGGLSDAHVRYDGNHLQFGVASGQFRVSADTSSFVNYAGTQTLATINSTGVSIPLNLDVDGHTNLDNLSVAGVSTFSGIVAAGVGSTAITLDNSHKITFGSAHELEMFHDGSNSYIKQRWLAYPSQLNIISENSQLNLMSGSGGNAHGGYENAITCHNNGAVKLYYAGVGPHLETYGAGVTVQGNIQLGDKLIHNSDTDTCVRFPAADTITAETAGTERLRITSSGEVKIMNTSGTVGLYFQSSSGAVSNFRAIGTNNQSLGYFFGNTEKVRFASNGNVNIGTGELDQTDRMLNVYGGRARISGITAGNSFEIYASNTSGQSYGILCQAGTNSSDINTALRNTSGVSLFRVRGDGVVFVGSSTVQQGSTSKLEVMGTLNNSYPGYSYPIMVSDDAAYNSSAGPGGGIGFSFKQNSGGAYAQAGGIRGIKENTTDGNYASALTFYTRANGAGTVEQARIDSSGNIGINESAPDTKLHISHSNATEDVIKLEATPVTAATGERSRIIFNVTQSNGQAAKLGHIASHTLNGWGGELAFHTKPANSTPNNATNEVMRLHANGEVSKPYHPSFSAHKGGGAIQIADNASADIVFADEKFDNGSNYNTSNGRFTAPVAGKYFFGIQLYLGFSITAIRVMHSVFKKNGSVSQQCDMCGGTNSDGGTHFHPTAVASCMVNLAANDYFTFNIGTHGFSGSGNTYLYAQSRFFGYLIG